MARALLASRCFRTALGRSFLAVALTLCAGAIGSPSILLRSGVGPADEIKAIGIEPKLSLSGVGRNLVDHAMVRLSWNAVPGPVDESRSVFRC